MRNIDSPCFIVYLHDISMLTGFTNMKIRHAAFLIILQHHSVIFICIQIYYIIIDPSVRKHLQICNNKDNSL